VIPIAARRASIRSVSTASTIRTDQRRAAARHASFTRRAARGFTVVSIAVALALPALWDGQAAAASQIFVTLEYQVLPAATGCADVSGFREGVQRQLGYDPFRAQSDRRVAVRVTRGDAGYEGRIQWTDARGRNVGERRLSTRRQGCTEILNNLAFAVAVQIQLLAAVAPPPPPPAPREPAPAESSNAPVAPVAPTLGAPSSGSGETTPAAEPSPAASVTPPPEPPVAPEPPAAVEAIHVIAPPPVAPADTTSKLQLSIGFGPSLALALAPRPTAMGRLFVDGRVSWLSVELSLDGALPVERQETSGASFSFHRFDAEGALCGHAPVLSACVTAGLAYLQASGSGVDAPRSPAGVGGQAGARVVASQDFGGRYFAALRAEGIVVLSRWTVDLNQLSAWSTPRLAALIGVDVGARIF